LTISTSLPRYQNPGDEGFGIDWLLNEGPIDSQCNFFRPMLLDQAPKQCPGALLGRALAQKQIEAGVPDGVDGGGYGFRGFWLLPAGE